VKVEETIDLRRMTQIALANKKILLGIIGICILIALIASLIFPKQYTSSVLVRAKSQGGGFSMQAAAMAMLSGGLSGSRANLQSYQEIIRSRSVLDPIITKTAGSFVPREHLEISNPRGTDLMLIRVTGKNPEEAQFIAQSVLESFQQTLTNLNQSEQSLHIRFLTGRIEVAKEKMEQTEREMEAFRQESRIFLPDEQAKSAIAILSEFDRRIAQLQVENQTNRATAQGIDEQLRKHNISLAQYNVAENNIINRIRAAIIDKQVELISLEQRYTDRHPGIISAREEIRELTATLQEEINKSIQAGTNILNPVHGYLLSEKTKAETGIISTGAAIDAMREAQAKIEAQISGLSANSLTYIGLERQMRISQEVYRVLVTNYEQTRIQEAMESMDIQVIDEANLPRRASWPDKRLFMAVGFALGVVFSFGWLLVLYTRQESKSSETSV